MAVARVAALRHFTNLSVGDLIETLIRNPPVVTFSRREPGKWKDGDSKAQRISIRISSLARQIVREWTKRDDVSEGDVIEALITHVPDSFYFPRRDPTPRRKKRRKVKHPLSI